MKSKWPIAVMQPYVYKQKFSELEWHDSWPYSINRGEPYKMLPSQIIRKWVPKKIKDWINKITSER